MKLIGWRTIPSELIGPRDMRRGASSPEEEQVAAAAAASILNRSSAFSKTSSENRYAGKEGEGGISTNAKYSRCTKTSFGVLINDEFHPSVPLE
jgi:hypothetical protein